MKVLLIVRTRKKIHFLKKRDFCLFKQSFGRFKETYHGWVDWMDLTQEFKRQLHRLSINRSLKDQKTWQERTVSMNWKHPVFRSHEIFSLSLPCFISNQPLYSSLVISSIHSARDNSTKKVNFSAPCCLLKQIIFFSIVFFSIVFFLLCFPSSSFVPFLFLLVWEKHQLRVASKREKEREREREKSLWYLQDGFLYRRWN